MLLGNYDNTLASTSPLSSDSFIGVGTFDVNAELMLIRELVAEPWLSGEEEFTGLDVDITDSTGGLAWDGSVTVSYEYEPAAAVPEPSTILLLGSGLLGAAGLRRKRKKG